MGRQVGLYMTTSDVSEFGEFLMTTGEVQLIPGHMASPDDRLERLPEVDSTWKRVLLYNPDVPGELFIREVLGRNEHQVLISDSPVIEFILPFFTEKGEMDAGRIWAEFTVLDYMNDALVPKDPSFKEWYEMVAKWLRKNYKRMEYNEYAGPSALSFHEGGGAFA